MSVRAARQPVRIRFPAQHTLGGMLCREIRVENLVNILSYVHIFYEQGRQNRSKPVCLGRIELLTAYRDGFGDKIGTEGGGEEEGKRGEEREKGRRRKRGGPAEAGPLAYRAFAGREGSSTSRPLFYFEKIAVKSALLLPPSLSSPYLSPFLSLILPLPYFLSASVWARYRTA